jgi:hypothetical protein
VLALLAAAVALLEALSGLARREAPPHSTLIVAIMSFACLPTVRGAQPCKLARCPLENLLKAYFWVWVEPFGRP